jgi:hypothetical protein
MCVFVRGGGSTLTVTTVYNFCTSKAITFVLVKLVT